MYLDGTHRGEGGLGGARPVPVPVGCGVGRGSYDAAPVVEVVFAGASPSPDGKRGRSDRSSHDWGVL